VQNFLAYNEGFNAQQNKKKKNESVVQKHFHAYHELYFLLSGKTKYFINNEIIHVNEGESVFIKSGYVHKTAYESESDSERILLSFSSEFVGEEYAEMLNELGKKKLFIKADNVKALFTLLYKEYTEKNDYYLEQSKNLLRQLIVILFRSEKHLKADKLSENEIIIQNAARYISENLCEDITLKKLAQAYAMSESHFSRTFKQYTGVGVSHFIKLTRLNYAEKLLKEGKYSITQIALKCGFNNSNYFISEFKRLTGITPLKYSAINKEK
jgi:AraC-like DNA-binding protein/quercetin dioxygenase-like cupin family protein